MGKPKKKSEQVKPEVPVENLPSNGEHYGKDTGYTYKDGVYTVAPREREAMEQLSDEADGLRRLADSVNAFIAERYSQIRKDERRWWARAAENMSLAKDKAWVYLNGKVSAEKPKEDPPQK